MEQIAQERPMKEPAAAVYLGCSQASMRLKRRLKNGPRYYRVGRLIRYRKRDLDEWIAAHSRGGSFKN